MKCIRLSKTIIVRSHAIELHIAKLKKYENEMKLFDEEKLSRLKREMLSVIKKESQDQEEKIEDLCKELARCFQSIVLMKRNFLT